MLRREKGFSAASSVEIFEDLFEKFDLMEVECVVGWLVLGSTRRTRSLFENVAEDRAPEVCLKSDIIFVSFRQSCSITVLSVSMWSGPLPNRTVTVQGVGGGDEGGGG